MSKIKVIIAHGRPVYCQGLSRLLEDEADIEVIAEATEGKEAARLIKELKPDVAIIDVDIPGLNGIEVAKEAKAASPETALLMLSQYSYGLNLLPCVRAGALGYLLETSPLRELINAIRSVHAGEEVFEIKAAADIVHQLAARTKVEIGLYENLRPRELDVLKLTARGMRNRDIAAELGISERTVHTHMVKIFKKLGVASRTEAVVHALKKGLVVLEDLSSRG